MSYTFASVAYLWHPGSDVCVRFKALLRMAVANIVSRSGGKIGHCDVYCGVFNELMDLFTLLSVACSWKFTVFEPVNQFIEDKWGSLAGIDP